MVLTWEALYKWMIVSLPSIKQPIRAPKSVLSFYYVIPGSEYKTHLASHTSRGYIVFQLLGNVDTLAALRP